MHASQQKVRNNENFNLFVAPQTSMQSVNPLFTLETCNTHTLSNQITTRSLPAKQRTPTTRQEVVEQTATRQETDKGGNLLSRLKQEAEGIRRWQTSVDMELKNKGDHIREMTSLIEEQRKSLLEVQLEYEKVSGLLQEERGNQEQLGKQLTHTRDLFSAVKENIERVEEEVKRSGDDSNDLSFFHDQLINRYSELRESYLLLQSRCEEVIKDLQTELKLSREECEDIHKKNDNLIEETTILNKDISNKTQVFEESLENLSSDLCQRETVCCQLVTERDNLSSQLSRTQGELENLTTKHSELNNDLLDREKDLGDKKEVNELLQNKYNELSADLDTVINAKSSIESLNTSLQKQLTELEEVRNEMKQELACSESKISTTCTELATRERDLLSERDILSTVRERVVELERQVSTQDEKLVLNMDQLILVNIELKQSEEERTKLKEQVLKLQNCLSSLSEEFEEERSALSTEISKHKHSIIQAEHERDGTENLFANSEQMNNQLSLEIGQSIKRNEDLQNQLTKKTEEADLHYSNLKTAQIQISNVSVELEQLTATVEEMKSDKINLEESHSKKVSLLESQKIEELTSHSEEISKLQTNHDCLKLSNETIEQKYNSQLEAHKREMNLLLNERQNNENEIKSLNEQSLFGQQQLDNAHALAAEGEEQAKRRVSEMLDSLCKYRKESGEILSAKNKEIEELKLKQASRLDEEVSKVTAHYNEELESIRDEKEQLELLLANIQKERRQELSTKRSITSTPKRTQATPKLSQLRTPCNTIPRPDDPPNTPNLREVTQPVSSTTQRENESEKRASKYSAIGKNFRTPSIHTNSNLKQKRKKIRLDDVSMEIINSQDDYTSSKHPTPSKQRPTRQCATPSLSKENIPSYLQDAPPATSYSRSKANKPRSAKSRASKEYNWFDSDVVFGLGTDD